MQVATFRHEESKGWSVRPFPAVDGPRTLVLVFAAPELLDAPAPLAQLAEAFPNSHVMGCSTAGEIFQSGVFDQSISAAALRFEHTSLTTATAPISSADESFAAGSALAQQLRQPSLRGVLVLSAGLRVNGSELLRGLNEGLPPSVKVTGGLAGDGDRFQRTWVLKGGVPREGTVAAVGFYGERLHFGHGSKGGWDIFGLERLITRSAGNILYELDGKPALELYKQYLGERASGLPATGLLFPLAIRSDVSDERSLVRTILAVDEATQSLTFAGDVPQGHRAQLMKANFDRLIQGAGSAAQMTQDSDSVEGDLLAVAISCVGRRLVLGGRTEEEVEATLEALPAGTRQVGFYSYGEISPYAKGRCDLHNQTMTLTTLGEV